jgi:hypothetical protein
LVSLAELDAASHKKEFVYLRPNAIAGLQSQSRQSRAAIPEFSETAEN